jgi:mannose-1-phosphate guanylyltransferase
MEPVTHEKRDEKRAGDANLGKDTGEDVSSVRVAAIPMPLRWLDVGSWPSYAQTCPHDEQGNALAAPLHQLYDSTDCLVASSEPGHLITTIGCHGLVVIHTKDATLVCPADQAEQIKELHKRLTVQFGDHYE